MTDAEERLHEQIAAMKAEHTARIDLGVPFNITSYALLTMMIAHVTGLEPVDFVHSFGDTHLYLNHIEQAKLQLTREPRDLPRLTLKAAVDDIFKFKLEDMTLHNYDPHPTIKAQVSV